MSGASVRKHYFRAPHDPAIDAHKPGATNLRAFKLDSPLYSAFANALQRVLEKNIPDHETAVSVWLQIQDLPEFGAIVRDEACWPSPTQSQGDEKP